MSSAQTRLPFRPSGHVAGDDPLGEALDDRGLPHSGLADQDRVVLRAAREHLDHAPDLLVAPDDRVELALLGELGQVAAELLERLVGALGILRRDALAAADLLQPREQLVARDGVEREQQVLGRDELVLELAHLLLGAVEDAARTRSRRSAAAPRPGATASARARPRSPRAAPPPARRAALRQLLVEQREQQVLGVDLGVAAAARVLLRGGDRLLDLDRQPVEVHRVLDQLCVLRVVGDEVAPVLLVHLGDLRRASRARGAPSSAACGGSAPRGGSRARRRRG